MLDAPLLKFKKFTVPMQKRYLRYVNMPANFVNIVFSSVLLALAIECTDLARGFGDNFEWHDLKSGLALSSLTKKPVMMIIHKSWCPACKALKPEFAGSKKIADLSKHFIMINVQDDEEPQDSKYSPDGRYIPRILFISPDGQVRKEFYNEDGNSSYKYFYSNAKGVVSTMKRVLDGLKKEHRATEEL